MGLFTCLLGGVCNDVHLMLTFGDKPAAEIKLEGKTITVEILNPLFAIEAVLEQIRSHKGASNELENLKKQGYKLIVKWKRMEFQL